MAEEKRRGWRYQPIWIEEKGERVFGLCEVWITEDDKLDLWTEDPFMVPQGDSLEELTGDIVRMLTDAYCWMPVARTALKVGMKFERAITSEQREALAKMVEATAHNFKAAGASKDRADG